MVMTPEKCMGMMLKTVAKIAEADQNAPVHDCVISVCLLLAHVSCFQLKEVRTRRSPPTSRIRSGTRCWMPPTLWA